MYREAEGLVNVLGGRRIVGEFVFIYLFIEGIAQGHLNVLGGRRIVGECSGMQKDCR